MHKENMQINTFWDAIQDEKDLNIEFNEADSPDSLLKNDLNRLNKCKNKGKTIAVVGPDGVGKSTLIDQIGLKIHNAKILRLKNLYRKNIFVKILKKIVKITHRINNRNSIEEKINFLLLPIAVSAYKKLKKNKQTENLIFDRYFYEFQYKSLRNPRGKKLEELKIKRNIEINKPDVLIVVHTSLSKRVERKNLNFEIEREKDILYYDLYINEIIKYQIPSYFYSMNDSERRFHIDDKLLNWLNRHDI